MDLLVEPAYEVNEKGTKEKNDGNENMSMDDNKMIEADSDRGSFAEDDWNDPEQDEVQKWTEPDMPLTTETKKDGRKRTNMRYNMYGDDFLIDKIRPQELGEELANVGELTADEEWQIIAEKEHSLQKDHTMAEKEMDLEQSEIERRETTNLMILEWIHNQEADEKEARSIQQVEAAKHVSSSEACKGGDPVVWLDDE